MKVCLIGSNKPYPAFDSVSSILRDILGQKQLAELRISNRLSDCPPPLKSFLYVFQDLSLCLKITSSYKKEKVNAILLFQGYYPLSSIASKLLNVKLLLFIGGSGFHWSYLEHMSAIGKAFAYANLPMQKLCHKFADAIVTLSENMIKMIGLENCKDRTWFALPRPDKEFHSQFEITKNYEQRNNIVGFVGSLCRRKGVLNFLQAISLIANAKNDCKFLLIGGGPLLKTIKTMVQRLGIDNSVKITGFVNYADLKKHYNEMKLYILPSYAEGVPSSMFEAMACGTPVLATPVGGIQDVIEDGKNGFLLMSTDPKHIASRIIELLGKPDLLKKMSVDASEYIEENFSYEKSLEAWREIFSKLGFRG